MIQDKTFMASVRCPGNWPLILSIASLYASSSALEPLGSPFRVDRIFFLVLLSRSESICNLARRNLVLRLALQPRSLTRSRQAREHGKAVEALAMDHVTSMIGRKGTGGLLD